MKGLVARVGQDWILVPVDSVHEVLDAPRPTRLPGAVAALEGVFAVRGTVLPLWRTDGLLDLDGDPSPAVCVRVRAAEGVHVGLLVDEVHGLAAVDDDRPPGSDWWTDGAVHLTIRDRTETVTVIDVAALLDRTS